MSHRVDTIVAALRNLGGRARPAEIADEIRRAFPGPHPRTLLNSVRGRLYEFSSDSKFFKGKRDLFYSVHGIGGGSWGLRDMNRAGVANPEANEPDLDRLIGRLERGAQPTYRSVAEAQGRKELLGEIARLREEIERLQPVHGGIGHNQPPPDQPQEMASSEIIAAVDREASTIESELGKEKPDALMVARSARQLQAFARWLGGKADTFTDELVRAFGKSLGKIGGAAIVASAIFGPLSNVVHSTAQWLQLVLSGF